MSRKVFFVSIGDIVSKVETWNPEKSKTNGEFDYIDISSIDRTKKSIIEPLRISAREAPSRARQLVRTGDILISTVRPNLNAVAQVPQEYDGAIASTGFCVLRPSVDKVNGKYLYYWLTTPIFINQMSSQAIGASYPAVTDAIVKKARLPLHNLDEQKRIAAILDKADGIRRKRREAIRLTDELLRSLFLELLGDPLNSSKKWEVKELGKICHKITDGVHAKPNYTNSGIPFISVKDITTGRLIFDDCKFISLEDHKAFSKRCRPEYMDILYTKVGATYGRPVIVDTSKEFSIYVSVALIKPNYEIINPVFLKEVLASPIMKRQADKSIKGIGVPDLHLIEIKNFLVPVPPMNIQNEIVNRVNQINNQMCIERTFLSDSELLFNSLAQRAFRGEL